MMIYCCACHKDINARLINGKEIYPHRVDLHNIPFWICDGCTNFVGCHYKTKNKTKPLGCIASPEIKNARIHIHSVLDPIWKSKNISRRKLYKKISGSLGYSYHTANIKSLEEARKIYSIIKTISTNIKKG